VTALRVSAWLVRKSFSELVVRNDLEASLHIAEELFEAILNFLLDFGKDFEGFALRYIALTEREVRLISLIRSLTMKYFVPRNLMGFPEEATRELPPGSGSVAIAGTSVAAR
jgi:hypothetical protein